MTRARRTHSRFAALAIALLASAPVFARAEEPLPCANEALEGQKARRAGKLLEAHDAFVACSKVVCARDITDQCLIWLGEVEAALPSLVIGAKRDGVDVVDGHVTIDGVPVDSALDGHAIPVDPGPHHVRVDAAGITREQETVAREGEKGRPVIFDLGDARKVPPPPPRTGGASAAVIAGGIFTGTAVVATAFFLGFGIKGWSDRSEFGCDVGCAAEKYDAVQRQFLVADVALGVAIGSAVVATVLFLVAPRAKIATSGSGVAFAF